MLFFLIRVSHKCDVNRSEADGRVCFGAAERGGEGLMEDVEMEILADAPTKIFFEVIPQDGCIETAQEIVKKIREANKGCSLRVEVRNVSR